eukprot:TRINITY_DN36395_c0_g1_i1.p1 TRINITY_DN36395_c0_g1~~TRINITY_DN36395_c0_g1_i1.p1  ORF type:complete len:716 (+),score=132.97 TRINITY_DN36395_c0_g1_i1:75-2222(+)
MKTDSRSFIAPGLSTASRLSDSSLLDRVEQKDDFNEKRFLCLTNPERALDTLSPFGVLELGIMSGRDLVEREAGMWKSYDTTADAFVEVFLDDLKLNNCHTPIARGKQDPIWKYSCKVESVAPQSMLRLQVVDDRATEKAKIGFVEICLADLPFDTNIEGWFELRFQENLQRTSSIRYEKHCKQREEHITAQATREAEQEAATDEVVAKKKEFFAKEKARNMDALQACMQSSADKAHELGLETLSESIKEGSVAKTRQNAGELYLQLKLTRVVGWCDNIFALALTPPRHDEGGGFELNPSIDIQYCADEISEFRIKLLDDALFCMYYWLKYMISWRSSLLSFIYLLGFMTACWHSYTMWAIAPSLAALSLVVNSFQSVRMFMTRGGYNSEFTDDGFACTAAWRSPDEMFKFVSRLVQDEMKALFDEHKLRVFAARCFRDGVPLVTIEELRLALTSSKIISKPEAGNHALAKGDLVWVDGQKAKIAQLGPSEDQITVLYETNKRSPSQASQPVAVPSRKVKLRAVRLPAIGGFAVQNWMIQGVAAKVINGLFPIMHDFKEAALPATKAVTDVLTWQNFRVSIGLTIGLLIISVAFSFAAILHILGEVSENGSFNNTAEVIVLLLRKADNVILTIFVLAALVTYAWWFAGVRSLVRIMSRMCRRRSAPAKWVFFKEDKAHKSLLSDLAQKESSTGLSQYHLSTSWKDARVTHAASNV